MVYSTYFHDKQLQGVDGNSYIIDAFYLWKLLRIELAFQWLNQMFDFVFVYSGVFCLKIICLQPFLQFQVFVFQVSELIHQSCMVFRKFAIFGFLFTIRFKIILSITSEYLTKLKFAGLPARYDPDLYDFSRTEGVDERQMRELREQVWIRRVYHGVWDVVFHVVRVV